MPGAAGVPDESQFGRRLYFTVSTTGESSSAKLSSCPAPADDGLLHQRPHLSAANLSPISFYRQRSDVRDGGGAEVGRVENVGQHILLFLCGKNKSETCAVEAGSRGDSKFSLVHLLRAKRRRNTIHL